MDMVVVVHPTLEDYSSQVHEMATKCGYETWLDLFEDPNKKMNADDRDDFSFITMAVGDQLIHREFISPDRSPGGDDADGLQVEPGLSPGSIVLSGVTIECPRLCGTH
ncbi:MAG: hypothetical protein P4L87_08355 [Formivibrio sp.]|nr:hypothetical protein [Formivibrio sp.]